ncbi:MAG TPA: cytochrome c [Blastocatellia bacterium]|nr:cytochrome c [Blastocatellia bacterium]
MNTESRESEPAQSRARESQISNLKFEIRRGCAFVAIALLVLTACEREQRRFREIPPGATAASAVRQSELQPGAPQPAAHFEGPYADNAWAVSEGQRLYSWFNCVGCHAHGGGAIGPPLMDDKWIYGSEPENIFATIIEGRPNGMPSFRGRLTNQQVWQLVAYVRSLSGQLPKDVSPGRPDDMSVKAPEQSKQKEYPVTQPAQHPQ